PFRPSAGLVDQRLTDIEDHRSNARIRRPLPSGRARGGGLGLALTVEVGVSVGWPPRPPGQSAAPYPPASGVREFAVRSAGRPDPIRRGRTGPDRARPG